MNADDEDQGVHEEVREAALEAEVDHRGPVREDEHDVEHDQRGQEPGEEAHGPEQRATAGRRIARSIHAGVPSSSSGAATIDSTRCCTMWML